MLNEIYTAQKLRSLLNSLYIEKETNPRKQIIHAINCMNAELETNARRRNIISIIKKLNPKDNLTFGIVKVLYHEISTDIRKRYSK